MGAGRKTQTFPLKEKGPLTTTIHCSISARNLGKKALGGVIFGATNITFTECMFKQLFGLPRSHYSYVKNVTPGMPLFLFNYSDRKLHGVFEAASAGKLNIDPYAWTLDRSDTTHYPAQVCVKIQVQCQPLTEEQFKPIIASNYYERSLFWFELDKSQTIRLITLFTSTPSVASASSIPRNTLEWSSLSGKSVSVDSHSSCNAVGQFVEIQKLEAAETCFPRKTWSSLFKPHNSGTRSVEGKSKESALDVNKSGRVHINVEQEPLWSWDNEADNWEDLVNDIKNYKISSFEPSSDPETMNSDPLHSKSTEVAGHKMYEGEPEEDTKMAVSKNRSLQECSSEWGSSFHEPYFYLCQENQLVDPPPKNTVGPGKGSGSQSLGSECLNNYVVNRESTLEDNSSEEYVVPAESALCVRFVQSTVAELVQVIADMKSSQLRQNQEINTLEQELVQLRAEIQILKNRIEISKSRSTPMSGHEEEEKSQKPSLDPDLPQLSMTEYDGHSWFSSLISCLPSRLLIKKSSPMSLVRLYASTATLIRELDISGAVDETLWYDAAYKLATDQWLKCPLLNGETGSLASSLFVIESGTGLDCFLKVGVFDLEVGRSVTTRFILHMHFNPAAVGINSVLYDASGYVGQDYFKYALGCYDGTNMVSTDVLFGFLMSLWSMTENKARGYMTVVMVGHSVYLIGRLQQNGQVLDMVELCSDDDRGWQFTNHQYRFGWEKGLFSSY